MTIEHSPLAVGAKASFRKTMTVAEQAMFTGISGNLGGLYVDAVRAKAAGAEAMVAFELATAALATTCLSRLGGPTRRVAETNLRFVAPVLVGDSIEASAEIITVDGDIARCRLSGRNTASGEVILEGEAVLVPFARG